jgi:hypothetical protein
MEVERHTAALLPAHAAPGFGVGSFIAVSSFRLDLGESVGHPFEKCMVDNPGGLE